MSGERERQSSDDARRCAHCGRPVRMKVTTAKYCNAVCRVSAGTARRVRRDRPMPPKEDSGE